MNPDSDKEQELQRLEQELKAREQALRLREIEAELYQATKNQEPPLYQTQKHNPPEGKLKQQIGKMVKASKFLGFTIFGIVIVKVGLSIGLWITYLVFAGIIGFVGYKLFFEDNRPNPS